MENIQIIHRGIGEIIPYAKNPRKNDHAVDAVVESIKNFGFLVPLVVTATGEIVTGHTRYKAAQKIGLQTVPCVIADGLTDEQIRAFRLVDNRVGEIADWDMELLPIELSEIAIDLSAFGFEAISEEQFGEDFTLEDGAKKPFQQISITLHDDQAALIHKAIKAVYDKGEVQKYGENENHNGNGIYEVVRQWAEMKKLK